jgi:hypothetical protein
VSPDWIVTGTTLAARVRVPSLLAGLTLDLLAAEFGPSPAARYIVLTRHPAAIDRRASK